MVIATTVLVANEVPRLDITPSCRASADGILGVKQDIDSCLQSESAAHDQLTKEWNTYPPGDRASCTKLTTLGGTGGTYTELITCLEMKRDAAKLPKEGNTIGPVAR
jgi:hypothetical protein